MNATPSKANATYTARRSFESFVLNYLQKSPLPRIPLAEIRAAFGKISRSTATRTIHRLAKQGLIQTRRYEQLWISRHSQANATPNATLRRSLAPRPECNGGPRNECNSSDVAWPSLKDKNTHTHTPLLVSHRFRFKAVRYNGEFVKNEDTRYSGRYHHIPTTFFREGTHTIVMHSYRIAIWIHDSEGNTINAQREDARNKALTRLGAFAHIHSLELEQHDLKKINGSEHTVEDKTVDEVLRPMVKEQPQFFDEKLGIAINKSSHPGEIELHERNRPITGPQFPRGERLEYIVDKFTPEHWPEHIRISVENQKLMQELTGTVIDIRKRVEALEVSG